MEKRYIPIWEYVNTQFVIIFLRRSANGFGFAAAEQHVVYWKDEFQKGVGVFGGPVHNPRGVYGVLAIRAASEREARSIASADPSVKGGVNHIEIAEMRIAFLPKGN